MWLLQWKLKQQLVQLQRLEPCTVTGMTVILRESRGYAGETCGNTVGMEWPVAGLPRGTDFHGNTAVVNVYKRQTYYAPWLTFWHTGTTSPDCGRSLDKLPVTFSRSQQSAPSSERIFCTVGWTADEQRTPLSGDSVDVLMFLHGLICTEWQTYQLTDMTWFDTDTTLTIF